MRKLRIAFVVQRYGPEATGGSEFLCRSLAERLAKYHQVEVLTTCAMDYVTWANHLPAGVRAENGITVRRFPVDRPRDARKFERLSYRVLNRLHKRKDEVRWMKAQGPYSSRLLDYLAANRDSYDLFVFCTYLYATTCFGLPVVADRAVLVPTAHDEPPIYLLAFDDIIKKARRLIFLTPEEQHFVSRRFCLEEGAGEVAGIGVDLPGEFPPDETWREWEARAGGARLVTYVGRVDPSKGCGELIAHFRQYVVDRPSSHVKLLLAGKSVMQVPDDPNILATGYVPEGTKYHALRASWVVVVPSLYESLSIAALEAWSVRKPVLVNGCCDALRGQCLRSNGGLWYRGYKEFRECLDRLLEDDRLATTLGGQGFAYVRENYTWEQVERRYLEIFAAAAEEATA